MIDRDFAFLKECPELKPLLDRLLKRYKLHGYDDVYVLIDMIFRLGMARGAEKAVLKVAEQLKGDRTDVIDQQSRQVRQDGEHS